MYVAPLLYIHLIHHYSSAIENSHLAEDCHDPLL